MPYSNSHSYIFVAISKTGTSSVVSTLKKIHKTHGGSLLLASGEIDHEFLEKYQFNKALKGRTMRVKHLSALQLKYILGENYNRYFSFTLVRNPWARTVSQYHYRHVDFMPSKAEMAKRKPNRKFHQQSFDKWITNRWKLWKKNSAVYRSQHSMIANKNRQVIIDYVGKLETIQDSLKQELFRGISKMPSPNLWLFYQSLRFCSKWKHFIVTLGITFGNRRQMHWST